MLFLILTNLTAHTHTLSKEVHQLVIQFVNLLAQLLDALCRSVLITDNEQREDIVEHIWCHLLRGVTPCLVRVAVALYNQTIEAQVHSLLTQRCNQLTTSTDMTGVADDWQLRNTTMQLDRNLPHRHVTIDFLVVGRETTVNGTQTLYASLIEALQRTNPQFQVWVHWVLHKHRDVNTLQRVGQSLHSKGVC